MGGCVIGSFDAVWRSPVCVVRNPMPGEKQRHGHALTTSCFHSSSPTGCCDSPDSGSMCRSSLRW